MTGLTPSVEDELLADISDEELEAAAGAPAGLLSFTLGSCTDMSSCPA